MNFIFMVLFNMLEEIHLVLMIVSAGSHPYISLWDFHAMVETVVAFGRLYFVLLIPDFVLIPQVCLILVHSHQTKFCYQLDYKVVSLI